jgi:ABC-type multidrug transport system fused ATPase/permease subunit
MNKKLNKFKQLAKDVLFVSKATKTKNKKIRISTVIVLSNLTAAADIGMILIFASIITGSFTSNNPLSFIVQFFLDYKIFIPLIVVARFTFVFATSIIMKKLEYEISENIRIFFLQQIFNRSNYSVSDAYFYINTLTGHITFFYAGFAAFINGTIQFLAYAAYLFIADVTTLSYFFGGILVLYYPLVFITNKTRKFTNDVFWQSWSVSNEIEKLVENIYLIKVLQKDTEEIENFNLLQKTLNKIDLNKTIFNSLSGFLPTFLTMFVLSILVGIPRIAKTLTLDFIGVTLRLFQALGTVSNSINNLLNSQIHINHFINFVNSENSSNQESFVKKNILDGNNVTIIDNASFTYRGSEVEIFENLNVKISQGSHTLITGPNGSGKSTLLGIFSGILHPEKGTVYSSVEKFGYIGAIPFIIKASLRENLTYGLDREISDKELMIKIKDFELFKEENSYDLDKQITNKSLSSGQMQKIAFIRALIADVNLLLLDESTANLDTDTENKIFEILKNQNITVINSTHEPQNFENIATNHIKISIENEKRILSIS